MKSRRRKTRAPRPAPHRCQDCEQNGGFVWTVDSKGRPAMTSCPKGIAKTAAIPAPAVLSQVDRAAGEREES